MDIKLTQSRAFTAILRISKNRDLNKKVKHYNSFSMHLPQYLVYKDEHDFDTEQKVNVLKLDDTESITLGSHSFTM